MCNMEFYLTFSQVSNELFAWFLCIDSYFSLTSELPGWPRVCCDLCPNSFGDDSFHNSWVICYLVAARNLSFRG